MSQHAHAKAANATVVEGRHCRLLLTVTQRHLVESGVGEHVFASLDTEVADSAQALRSETR